MHSSIGAKLFICKLDYSLKVDEPSTNAKNGMCVRICSKFSVKCEASHKNIVKVDFFLMFVALRVGNYMQVLHLTITVCRKLQDKVYIRSNIRTYCNLFFIKERVPAEQTPLFCFMHQSSRAIFKECGCNGITKEFN